MYETIMEKINNDNPEFSEEEIEYIKSNSDLKQYILKSAFFNEELSINWTDELNQVIMQEFNGDILNQVLDQIEKTDNVSEYTLNALIEACEKEEFSKVLDRNLVYRIAKILNRFNAINKGNFTYVLKQICKFVEISDNETFDTIIKIIEKIPYINSNAIPNIVYEYIIKNKRFDLLENRIYTFDNLAFMEATVPIEIQKKIIDTYDWKHFQSPDLLDVWNKDIANYIIEKKLLKKLTIRQLLLLKKSETLSNEKIFELIMKKKITSDYKYSITPKVLYYKEILELTEGKSEEETIKFLNQILKGGLPVFINDYTIPNFVKKMRDINVKNETISNLLNNNDELFKVYDYSTLEFYFTRSGYDFNSFCKRVANSHQYNDILKKLLKNPNVVKTVLDAKSFISLFNRNNLTKEIIDYTISAINRGDEKFDNLSSNSDVLEVYPKIEEALHKRNINCTYDIVLSNVDEYPEYIRRLETYPLDKYNLIDTYYPRLSKNKEIINYLFQNKKYDIIFSNIGKLLRDYSDEVLTLIKSDKAFYTLFIDKIGSQIWYNIYVFEYKDIILYYLDNPKYAKKLLDCINHDETLTKYYSEDVYNIIKKHYQDEFDLKKLDAIEEKFGPYIIRFLSVDALKKICNLNDEDFSKFINLFNNKEFKMSQVEAIYDSIKQLEVPIDIFSNILHSIDEGNDEYIPYLEKIVPYLDANFFLWFNEKYEIDVNSPRELLIFITDKIKFQPEKREKYTNILHEITNYYLAKIREEHRNTYDIYTDMKIPVVYEEKSLEKITIDFFSSLYGDTKNDSSLAKIYINMKEIFFIDVKEYLKKFNWTEIDYQNLGLILKGGTDKLEKTLIKKLMKEYNEACKYSYSQNKVQFKSMDYTFIEEALHRKIKKLPILKDDAEKRYQILLGLNLETMTNTILKDNELYTTLKEILDKRQIINMPDFLVDYLNKTIVSEDVIDNSVFSAFISLFSEIYKEEKKKLNSQGIKDVTSSNFNLVKLIKYGKVYSGISSIYNLALTTEDANLIKLNPRPNAATNKSTEERLKAG